MATCSQFFTGFNVFVSHCKVLLITTKRVLYDKYFIIIINVNSTKNRNMVNIKSPKLHAGI